jgi:hypothetical protein
MGLWPTQADEKPAPVQQLLSWKHRPPPCHPDRSGPGFPTSHC